MQDVTQADVIATPRGRFLTSQERQFVVNYASGMPVRNAAKTVGMTPGEGVKLLDRQDIAETVGAVVNTRLPHRSKRFLNCVDHLQA